MSILEQARSIWNKIKQTPVQLPSKVNILADHISNKNENLGAVFREDEHYFQVRINEMYLTYQRQWFSTYDPMVFIVSEFQYDGKIEAVPFTVGPMMMEKYGQKIPTGMIFSNTRVAGLHPWRGGSLTLSVILMRVKRDDYPKKLLRVVESAASAVDFGTALTSYVKIAGVIFDGVEALLGAEDTTPLIGFRKTIDQDAGDKLEPGYLALIDIPEDQLDLNKLWVRDHQLLFGDGLAGAQPFRKADYVLYSISQTSQRSDEETLPFYPLWKRVVEEASRPKPDNWDSAKSNMLSLYQTMMLSPDLTKNQAFGLTEKYTIEMKKIHEKVVGLSTLGEEKAEPSAFDRIRKQSLDILKM